MYLVDASTLEQFARSYGLLRRGSETALVNPVLNTVQVYGGVCLLEPEQERLVPRSELQRAEYTYWLTNPCLGNRLTIVVCPPSKREPGLPFPERAF